jgi:hypothetical protein
MGLRWWWNVLIRSRTKRKYSCDAVSNILKTRCECHLWRLTLAERKFAGRLAGRFLRLKIQIKNYSARMERATGIEPVLPVWEFEFLHLYFQHLQNRSAKVNVHATHTVHAVPDLRVAAGRFVGRFLSCVAVRDRRFDRRSIFEIRGAS